MTEFADADRQAGITSGSQNLRDGDAAPGPWRHAAGMWILLFCAGGSIADKLSAAEKDTRRGWQFETPAGKRTIVNRGDRRWMIYYPNGTTAPCVETDRTPEYVEIRNLKNQAVQRLYDRWGEVQKNEGAPFRRFAAGRWLPDGDVPEQTPDRFGPTDFKIRVVYFVARDRKPTAHYRRKIEVVLALIAEVLTADLRSKGWVTPGPQFETRGGVPVIHLLTGEKTAAAYNDGGKFNSPAHFASITREVDRRLGSLHDHIVMVFAETYDEGPADRVWPGHVARAAAHPPNGGVGVFSAWILRDEFCATDIASQRRGFFDHTPIRGRRAIGHRGPNSPRAEFIEDGIGGMLHELAHTFGLPHDPRERQVNIMGQGFRNLRWNVAPSRSAASRPGFSQENARLLMGSRYLNPAVERTDHRPAKVELNARRTGRELRVTVRAADETGLSSVVVLDVSGSDRKMLAGRPLQGTEQQVEFQLPAPGQAKLQVIVVDQGGNHTKLTRDAF